MNSFFENKIVYIFSPQPWNYLQISKHHYARELAKKNQVYFIEPPKHGNWFSLSMDEIHKGLIVVQYCLAVPGFLRFKFPRLYKIILKNYLSNILRKQILPADVAFDFGCYQQFDTLNFIRAKYKIFFPVDDFDSLPTNDRGANIILTVSKNIQAKFPFGKCHFINHGLSDEFSNKIDPNRSSWVLKEKIRVGCSGNLFIRFLDADNLIKIIKQNPSVEFNFFGSYEPDLSVEWQRQWSSFLETSSNVRLHGMLSSRDLASAYDDLDIFLLCYKPDNVNYHGENSHKVLEYLSTGKIVVSTHLTIYDQTELFEMSPQGENDKLTTIFLKITNELRYFNSEEKQEVRKKFALENTYKKQLSRISDLILQESE
jgi:glycosyltransferase involved in cell wall biosynthesis